MANNGTPPQEEVENSRFPYKPGQFRKGQSGNPNGRPKGKSLTARLRAALDKREEKGGKVLAELIAEALIRKAKKGDVGALKEVFDRVDGRVPLRMIGDPEQPIIIKVLKGVSLDDL